MMKRLWGIRHLRYWWHEYHLYRWALMWGRAGIGLGFPHEADLDELQRIWEGTV